MPFHPFPCFAGIMVCAVALFGRTLKLLHKHQDRLGPGFHVSLLEFTTSNEAAISDLIARGSDAPHCRDDFPMLTFNEKVHWRMQHDRSALLPLLTDKVSVRRLAAVRGVPTVPLLYSGICDGLPNLSELPASFAFKASHTSGCNLLVVDGRIVVHRGCIHGEASLEGQNATDELLRDRCEDWLGRLYYSSGREWAYSRLAPSLVIETMLADGMMGGALADDLKCFTFQGRTAYVVQVNSRFACTERPVFANDTTPDRECKTDTFYLADGTPRPDLGFDESVPLPWNRWLPASEVRHAAHICDIMGTGIDFARIDLLRSSSGDLFLGEVTVYPMAGKTRWRPPAFDMELSQHWCIESGIWDLHL